MVGPDFSLAGRVALVTGAGRGIGLGIARGLAAQGCAVAIGDIALDVAQGEAGKINNEGGKAIGVGGDMGDLTLAERLMEEVGERLGAIGILINNAAVQSNVPWLEVGPEVFEREYRVNVIMPQRLVQLAMPIFRRGGYGRIINVGSIQMRGGAADMLPYSTTKVAIAHLTRVWARELAAEGITSNLIAPGFFDTYRNREVVKWVHEDPTREKAWVPMGRMGKPEDCAGIAVCLCSPAGAYITGQHIFVDGGMSAKGSS